MSSRSCRGRVDLVGAGPGDPDLITVKGRRILAECDVVIHDALVHRDALMVCKQGAEKVFVGIPRSRARWPQRSVEKLMIRRAREGKRVVRLKAGDPFVFGRGGEEAEALSRAGIPWDVVPGVTAGTAVPAMAGIPLTHRGVSSSAAFITGRQCSDSGCRPVDWSAIARACDTLVIFMGAQGIDSILERILRAGRSPRTPVVAIENGTLPNQRIHEGVLGSFQGLLRRRQVASPTLVVIGDVASVRHRIADSMTGSRGDAAIESREGVLR